MRKLLAHGADFECYDSTKHRTMHHVISHGHDEMAIIWLEHASRQAESIGERRLWPWLTPRRMGALGVKTAKGAAKEKEMVIVVSMVEELEREWVDRCVDRKWNMIVPAPLW